MAHKTLIRAMACGVLAASAGLAQAQPLTETFTYQGRLSDDAELADGFYDFQFRLFTDAGATSLIGNPITRTNVQVVDGLFTVTVNFGGSGLLFDGDRRWLQVSVRPAGSGSYTALSPAQEITAAPHATYSSFAGIAQVAETAMLDLTDAYNNGSIIDATSGPVQILKSNGGLFDPAYLRIGSSLGSAAGGHLEITSSNGNTAILANALGSSNSGNLQVFDALDDPMISAQMDVSSGGGGYLNVYRRNDTGSTPGSFIGFQVDGNFGGLESTHVTIRGDASTMFFQTHLTGDASVQIPADSISATELLNEPGVAETANSGSTVLTPAGASIDVITSATITCPTSGYVLVIATGEVSVSHVGAVGGVGGITSTANFGVSNSSVSLPSNLDVELRLENDLFTGTYDFPVTVHGVFAANAGSNTFYFLGDQNSTGHSITVLDSQVSCIFIPTAYGTAALQAPPMPDMAAPRLGGLTAQDVQAEQEAAILANEVRVDRELAEMRARIEEMERLLAKQEQR